MYKRYKAMIYRCYQPKNQYYPAYGGRGIYVCDRWRESFVNYLEDVGCPPFPRAQIDRIDNDGPYSPENCRWATQQEQLFNTRRNRLYTIDGVTKPRLKWCREYGMDVSTFRYRMRKGWGVLEALTTPPSRKYYGKKS